MPKKTSGRAGARERYWERRLGSKEFQRALTAVVRRELQLLSAEKVENVVDPQAVRRAIRGWTPDLVDRDAVADVVIEFNRRLGERLKQRRESLVDLLDDLALADVEGLLEADVEMSRNAEEFVAKLMQQEFVRRLFTDIIYTSIVSFNQKVNPLFGAITMRVMEEQIKSFIRLFMPAVQRRATAFAVSEANQRILVDFGRSIIRQLLEEPLRHYASLISSGQRKRAEALVRRAVGNAKLDGLIRDVTVATWDDLYESVRSKRVGEVARLEKKAGWMAERIVELLMPALARPGVVEFVESEVARAGKDAPPPRGRGARGRG